METQAQTSEIPLPPNEPSEIQTLLNQFTQMAAEYGISCFEEQKAQERQHKLMLKIENIADKIEKTNKKMQKEQAEQAKAVAEKALAPEETVQ
jgi:hypothetical protein